ncbi:hypothetical protein [Streptomyces mirabilis]
MTTQLSGSPPLGAPAWIPSLPGLGTTWYERGARYWLRRACGAVLPALLAYAVGWFLAAFTVREYPGEVGARRVVEG